MHGISQLLWFSAHWNALSRTLLVYLFAAPLTTEASFTPMTDLDLGCIFHSGTAPSPAWSLRGALERREFGHTICGARGPARWRASPPRAAAARRAPRDARSRRRRESGRRVIPIRVGRRRVAPPTRAPPGLRARVRTLAPRSRPRRPRRRDHHGHLHREGRHGDRRAGAPPPRLVIRATHPRHDPLA